MKTPECPGRGNCGNCPIACGSKALVLETSAISIAYEKPSIIGKIDFTATRQRISISTGFSGGPIPREAGGCKDCAGSFLGSCSKHSKVA